jgi:hypothetical protein
VLWLEESGIYPLIAIRPREGNYDYRNAASTV